MTIEVLDALERRLSSPALLEVVGEMAISLVQKNIRDGAWTPNAPLTQAVKGSGKPLMDRGQLLSRVSKSIRGGAVVISVKHPGARILHDGGEIRAVSARFLAVPAGARARAFMRSFGATPRACIEAMKASGYSFWYQGPVLMTRKGKKGEPHPLFIMKKSVRIPARPYLRLPEASIELLKRTVESRVMG